MLNFFRKKKRRMKDLIHRNMLYLNTIHQENMIQEKVQSYRKKVSHHEIRHISSKITVGIQGVIHNGEYQQSSKI